MTIRWFAFTSCRPVANGWGLRPKSRITSSGVAVTRQKFEYDGSVPESSTYDLGRLLRAAGLGVFGLAHASSFAASAESTSGVVSGRDAFGTSTEPGRRSRPGAHDHGSGPSRNSRSVGRRVSTRSG